MGERAGVLAARVADADDQGVEACVGLPVSEVNDVIDRLRTAQLVVRAQDAGIEGGGFLVPEVGRLLEFLEFLNLKDRFGG